jgi:putative peptide zinc metalloprotease protein
VDLLPKLREDLKLFRAANNRDGSPAWMIQDPVGNRFFRIGWLEFELLSRWDMGLPMAVLMAVNRDTALKVETGHLQSLVDFLRNQQLLHVGTTAGSQFLSKLAQNKKQALWKWLLHNYLFFRLPLVKPGRFFERTLWLVAPFYTRTFAVSMLICALIGLVLVGRQWDTFVHTFVDMLSPQGFLGYGLALIFAKTLHELGHAYTATRYGVRVAHMGVAFLVMWPMLYTDTSESWKLIDRKQRFRIAAAGMAAEFSLAAVATLLWSLADQGSTKSALFFLATTSWIITVGLNASPFMRFDGYFLLSDTLDLPNLHERAGALARAALRRVLLGWNEPDPEPMEPGLRRGLIAFAYFTWLYRLTVFIGIAIAVYVFFFKLLGIFLFVVEIAWFVVKPIWGEVKKWPARRGEILMSRRLILITMLLALLALVFYPWQRSVHAESWAHAEKQQLLYSPIPARLVSLREPGPIKAGEVFAVLDSPDARSRAAQSGVVVDALALQLDQTIGRSDGHERRAVIMEQLAQQVAEVQAQTDELKRLELRAPFEGVLLDRDPEAKPGAWLNASQALAMLVDTRRWVAEGLVEQRDVQRIALGDVVQFYRRGQFEQPIEGKVVAIDSTRTQSLPHVMLATDHGGRVAVIKQQNGQITPRDSLYRIRIALPRNPMANSNEALDASRVLLGSLRIQGQARSLGGEWWNAAVALMVRESGF